MDSSQKIRTLRITSEFYTASSFATINSQLVIEFNGLYYA